MADQEQQQQDNAGQEPGSTPPDAAQNTETYMIPKARFDEVNERYKTTQRQLADLQKQIEADEAARMAEQGKYKELYDEAQQKLSDLTAQADRATELEAAIRQSNQSRIDQLPDDNRALVPEFDDPVKTRQWLDANASRLMAPGRPQAPPLDGGAGSGGRTGQGPAALTDEERLIAKNMGLAPEDYAKFKSKE